MEILQSCKIPAYGVWGWWHKLWLVCMDVLIRQANCKTAVSSFVMALEILQLIVYRVGQYRYYDGSIQGCSISIAKALEILPLIVWKVDLYAYFDGFLQGCSISNAIMLEMQLIFFREGQYWYFNGSLQYCSFSSANALIDLKLWQVCLVGVNVHQTFIWSIFW